MNPKGNDMRTNKRVLASLVGITATALLLTMPNVLAQDGNAVAAKPVEAKGDPYTLNTCPVSGEELGEGAITKEINGREARFCCTDCVGKFEKDTGKYWAIVDAKIIEQQLPWYPDMTCPVSGGKLGGMGDPLNYVYKNRLVRFCCAGCIKSFEKDPATYIAKIDEQVIAQQTAAYPLEKCIIAGGALDGMGGPLDKVYANRLVRYCCAGCIKSFKKDPVKHFATIDKAYGAHSPANTNTEEHEKKESDEHGHSHGG